MSRATFGGVGIGLRVDTDGAEELYERYSGADEAIAHWFRGAFWGILIQMQAYPPPIPNSSYQRTMNLKHGWLPPNSDFGDKYMEFDNDMPYAPYVQGAIQARVHWGRWKTLYEVADPERLARDLESMLTQYLDTGGLGEDLPSGGGESFFGKIVSGITGFFKGLFGK